MAQWYDGRIVLIDEHGHKTSMNYDLGVGADPVAAMVKLNALAVALDAVTDANLFDVALTAHDDTNIDASIPTEAEATEEAVLSVHLLAEPLAPKYAILRIPAPSNGIFLGDKESVDITDVDLLAYVAAVAANALVSDGETIVTARDYGGIGKTAWRSKAKQVKTL